MGSRRLLKLNVSRLDPASASQPGPFLMLPVLVRSPLATLLCKSETWSHASDLPQSANELSKNVPLNMTLLNDSYHVCVCAHTQALYFCGVSLPHCPPPLPLWRKPGCAPDFSL